MKTPTVSVVFSFYNEEDVLPELISRTRKVLEEQQQQGHVVSYELIFVNDASTDRSVDILKQHAKESADIRIINMSRNFGVSPCVMAGMEYASGELVVYMDADLQDPPELIPDLLKEWREGENVDVVHTVRLSRKGEPKIKLFITKVGYRILHSITTLKLPIETGDFKLLSRRVVNHLVNLKEKRPFIRGLVCWVGFNQKRVYYHRPPRAAGKTKFNVFGWKVISNFLESALVSFSSLPLQFASLMGFVAIIVSLALSIHVVIQKIQGVAVPGWTALMAAVLFLGSIQLFCLGVIGLYIHNIFEESKGRPNFIVESTWGFPEKDHEAV
ncbi:MAG: glycosyltransferase family 2 protein [Candidatus Omnitrophica bacterium]|nr:glycosyltransferase family 2 protein [Candidatus Omnitrophota bacterium]